jgi:hypothetical protein
MQHAMTGIAFAVFFVTLWTLVCFLIAAISGWQSLAKRYRTEREFPAHRRGLQSAQMRMRAGYNNILTVGSDAEGIYLDVLILFRPGHPRLFIPWTEVQAEEPTRWLFLAMRTLRLGPDGIPLKVRMKLADFLLQARDNNLQPQATQ